MFSEIEDGSFEDIQGLKCWKPKVGYLFDHVKGKWVYKGVYNRVTTPKECYWEVDPRFKVFDQWKEDEDKERAAESKRTNKKATYINNELQKFIEDCWLFRRAGFWFMNKGIPTYITGSYWYYLSCFQLDTRANPKYRDQHRQFYYAWQYCVEDPQCYGLNFVAKRRQGKSYMAASIGLEAVTDSQNYHFGIQSKTEPDAKNLFSKHVITPYRSIPFFFKPKSNITAGKTPATTLKFETGRMDSAGDEELQSYIDFGSSEEHFYDGHKLQFYWADETGKSIICNVDERWQIIKKSLRDDEDNIIGKSLHTTTVEDIDKGGGNYLKIWSRSDQNKRNELGETESGMYKFFMPADLTYMPDKFGFSDREEGRRVILIRRASITDQRALSSAKRFDPLDEKEAFSIDASTCVFSAVDKLNERYDVLKYIPTPLYNIGNMHWIDGIRDNPEGVEFVKATNGKFMVALEPLETQRNRHRVYSGMWEPENTDMFCGGGDPYNHAMLSKDSIPTMSLGAFVILKRENPLMVTPFDNNAACLYVFRPDDPEIFYEDMLKACIYYGCKILIEDNKDNCIDYFKKRGYEQYLTWLDGRNKPGISNTSQSSGGGTNGLIAELTDHNITHFVDNCAYHQLIDDWLKFNPAKTTEFDAAMAYGFALINSRSLQLFYTKPSSMTKVDLNADLGFRYKRHQRFRSIYHGR